MKIEMTPLKVEILLWYFCSQKPFPNLHTDACRKAVDELVKQGIAFYVETPSNPDVLVFEREALAVYIEEILRVPLPTKTWTIVR